MAGWLVLCEPGDHSALWAAKGLVARGLAPLEIVTPAMLVAALAWEHRLGRGGTTISIALSRGRRIDGEEVCGILNRIGYLPPALFARAAPGDRCYANQEMTALFLSWLTAIRAPVWNRPTPQGLSGCWQHPSYWAVLAARAGLDALPYRQGTGRRGRNDRLAGAAAARHTVIVAGRKLVGSPAPPDVSAACLRLSQWNDSPLLGVELVRQNGHWLFAGATPHPDLRIGGEPLLDALAEALRGDAA